MFDLEFSKPGKSYKLVKTVTLSVANSQGEITGAKVPIYLKTIGTPGFAVGLPGPYADFWEAHRNTLSDALRSYRGTIDDGVLCVDQFDHMEGALPWLSKKFAADVKNRHITKVIVLRLMLRGPGVLVNPPSFADEISHIAGLGATIRYEVNGRLYFSRGDCQRDWDPDYMPKWEDLSYSMQRGSGDGHTLPFSVAAWKTLNDVKGVLEKAAVTLAQLKDPTEAALLLSSGTLLLGGGAE